MHQLHKIALNTFNVSLKLTLYIIKLECVACYFVLGWGGGGEERERETNSITTCKVVTKEAAEGANIIGTRHSLSQSSVEPMSPIPCPSKCRK